MQQTIVSVVFPADPAALDALQAEMDTVRKKLAGAQNDFAVLRAALPTLHFMSVVLFAPTAGVPAGDPPATPQFILEANFDGAPGPFWAALQAVIGEDLRSLIRLCAPPLGASDTLFQAITAEGARTPVAPLLERQSVFPEASHIGARALSQIRIQEHNRLFAAAEAQLPPPAEVLSQGAVGIHGWLRAQLLPSFAWLAEPYEATITVAEKNRDLWLLLGFAALSVLCAILPWLLLGKIIHPANAAAIAFLVGAGCTLALKDIGALLTLAGKPEMHNLWVIIAVTLLIAAGWLPSHVARTGFAAWVILCVAGLIAGLLILLAALRNRERADPVPADSVPDPAAVRALQAWEDCHLAGSDHMASLVTIKPGRFRIFLVRFGMTALARVVRVTATDGYLGSMRTIHFAHWAIVDHGRRLLFFSNFDGSWESYLDDFVEKAHAGLTLAWGNCLGFPPPRYLTLDGATKGRKFKAWARCSMTPSSFWYAAYPDLTVNQIIRQAAVAKGLCSPSLSAAEAKAWAKEL